MGKMSDIKGWLSAEEAARIIGRSLPSITRYCQQGLLPHKRVGRTILIREEDAARFVPRPRGNPQFIRA